MSVETTEQRRSDAATTVLTDRDLFALTWISHQYAIRLDHLQVLLGQQKGVAPSMSATRKLANWWMDAGWVELRRFRMGELPWIWPTQEGLNSIGSRYPYRDFNAEDCYTLPWPTHLAAINDLHLQSSADWKSQRQLFQDVAGEYESIHEPDAEIRQEDGKIIAIKAQVWIKDATELAGNLVELLRGKLSSRYAEVWYFGVPDARDQIRRVGAYLIQQEDLSIEEVSRLRIKWYPCALTDEERRQQDLETRIPV